MNKNIAWVWAFVFLLVIGYLLQLNSSLPDHLAVHFDINGKPNGFQSHSEFIATFFGFIVLLNGIFVVMYWSIEKIPTALINIPWKNYWFSADDRKVEAFERLRAVMALTGIFVCSALLLTEQVIYQANASDPLFVLPINAGLFVISMLALFMIVLCFVITKPPKNDPSA